MKKHNHGFCLTLFLATLLPFSRPFAPQILTSRQGKTSLFSQVLEFVEPTTGVTVKLVGSMHYNPASIKLAQETIEELAESDRLGSVVIESCDLRWETTMETDPRLQRFLLSEMRAAYDLALLYNRPLVLGDQRINITTSSMGAGFRQSVMDLARPIEGWRSFWSNVTEAREQAVPLGDGYLNAFAFLEPKLLMAAPVSLAKYPLSYIVKSPVTSLVILSLIFFADSAYAAPIDEMSATDWFGEFMGAALETALFSRVFLKELLVDRNVVLARNIIEQCKYYQDRPSWRDRFGGRSDAIYAEGSERPSFKKGKVVVAVLGLAHCNGIKKILVEKRV